MIRSYFTSNTNFYVHHINLTKLSQYEFNDLLCVPAHMELTGLVTTMHSAHHLHNSNVLTWEGKSNSTKLALWLKIYWPTYLNFNWILTYFVSRPIRSSQDFEGKSSLFLFSLTHTQRRDFDTSHWLAHAVRIFDSLWFMS